MELHRPFKLDVVNSPIGLWRMDLRVGFGLCGCFSSTATGEYGNIGTIVCSFCRSGDDRDPCFILRSDSNSSIFEFISDSIAGELATDLSTTSGDGEDCFAVFSNHAHR